MTRILITVCVLLFPFAGACGGDAEEPASEKSVGEEVEEAADDTGDAIEEAAEDTGDAIDEATEDADK